MTRKAKPILFNPSMVFALDAGDKTVTRRPVQGKALDTIYRLLGGGFPIEQLGQGVMADHTFVVWDKRRDRLDESHESFAAPAPYGTDGGIVWVRETWAHHTHAMSAATDKDGPFTYRAADWEGRNRLGEKWKPNLHMPKEACRLFFMVKSVRIEYLTAITPEEVAKEGMAMLSKDGGRTYKHGLPDLDGLPGSDNLGWAWADWDADPVQAFKRLWLMTGGQWDEEQLVWRYELESCAAPQGWPTPGGQKSQVRNAATASLDSNGGIQ